MTKNYLRYLVAAAFVAASGASNVAFAEIEMDDAANDSITSPQRLAIRSSDPFEVTGAIGFVGSGGPVADVDFYSFQASAGSIVTVDIDGGIKTKASGLRSVDTVLAIFGPDLTILRQEDDMRVSDPGSNSKFDARLENVLLPVNGTYIVGVSSSPRGFVNGGGLTSSELNNFSNGSYTLIISGVKLLVQQISIDIKPGARSIAPINPKAKGNIPVALLSSPPGETPDFDALKADPGSIKFGPTGTEASAERCGKGGEDVNGDGRLDLVCHFDNQAASFETGDNTGMVTGMRDGIPFEGSGWLKVIPAKRQN